MKTIFNIFITILIPLSIITGQNAYRLEREILGRSESATEVNRIRYKVNNLAGDQYYSFIVAVDYDMPYPAAYVFDDGICSLVWSFDASIDFYNTKGEFISKIYLFGESRTEYERSVYASVDGDQLAVAVSDPMRALSIVKIINSRRETLNEWEAGSKNITGLALSASHNVLAVSGYNYEQKEFVHKTNLYSGDGTFIKSFNKSFREGKFSDSETFIGYDNRNVFSIDLKNLLVVNEFKTEGGELVHKVVEHEKELAVLISKTPVLLNGKWKYPEPGVVTLIAGKEVNRRKIFIDSFYNSSLDVSSGEITLELDGKPIILE